MYDGTSTRWIALYSSIFEHALEATAVVDDKACVLVANRAAREAFGVEVGRVLGGSGEPGELVGFFAQLRAGTRASSTTALRDREGQLREIELDGLPHEGRYVVSLRDVTAARRAEAELTRLRRGEAARQVAAAAAHDMNNLLALIVCMATELARQTDPDQSSKLAIDVRSAADRAARLARHIIALGRVPEQPRLLGVGDAIGELRSLIERTLGDRIELCLALGANAPSVRVDSEELGRVLINLAVNARDAMPNGGRVTIGTADVALEGDAPNGYLRLTFADSGVGMPESVRERALDERFTTKGSGGTGLGLANARDFARRSGGCIAIHSAPGQGTTIAIYLPCSRAVAIERAEPCDACSGSRTQSHDRAGFKRTSPTPSE